MLFKKNFFSNITCHSCGKQDHTITECGLLNLKISKEIVIKKLLFQKNLKRKIVKRSRKKYKNSLINQGNLKILSNFYNSLMQNSNSLKRRITDVKEEHLNRKDFYRNTLKYRILNEENSFEPKKLSMGSSFNRFPKIKYSKKNTFIANENTTFNPIILSKFKGEKNFKNIGSEGNSNNSSSFSSDSNDDGKSKFFNVSSKNLNNLSRTTRKSAFKDDNNKDSLINSQKNSFKNHIDEEYMNISIGKKLSNNSFISSSKEKLSESNLKILEEIAKRNSFIISSNNSKLNMESSITFPRINSSILDKRVSNAPSTFKRISILKNDIPMLSKPIFPANFVENLNSNEEEKKIQETASFYKNNKIKSSKELKIPLVNDFEEKYKTNDEENFYLQNFNNKKSNIEFIESFAPYL